jgi:hypothetical protein
MSWILVIFLFKMSEPSGLQNVFRINFGTELECNQALNTIDYWSKNKSYKVEARCIKQATT